MKITYFLTDYTSSGGLERIIAVKTNYLIEHGFEVCIVTYSHNGNEPFFDFNKKIQFYDLDIKYKDANRDEKFIERATKYLNRMDVDIAIATSFRYHKYLYKVKDRSKKIYELHESKYRRQFWYAEKNNIWWGRLLGKLYSWNRGYNILRNYDRLISLTYEDASCWHGFKNLEVIHNCLPIIPITRSSLSNKKVVALGKLSKLKQFDQLIHIWHKIHKVHPDWKLEIYGEGSEKENLSALIKKLRLKDCVTINSPVKDVMSVYTSASIFALTSLHEGLPLVILEALSYGVPAVSYACKCGPRDLIDDEINGFLVKRGDMLSFAEKLSLLMKEPEMRKQMGRAAYTKSLEFYPDEILLKWVHLFEDLDKNKSNQIPK